MNTGSLVDFPVLAQPASGAKAARSPPSSPNKRQKQDNVPDLGIPIRDVQGTCFAMHDDSGDEGSNAAESMDLENIFEFDTNTLIQLANKACGKHPDSFWDDDDIARSQSSPWAVNSAEYDAATVERLKRECAQKDQQIEVLKHTVCELLVWKATHARQLQQLRQQQVSPLVAPTTTQKRDIKSQLSDPKKAQIDTPTTAPVHVPTVTCNKMRADAPEFVSLGIPSLALKKPAIRPVAVQVKPPTLSTPRKRIGAIQMKHGQEPVSSSPTCQKDWRIERRANAHGYSANWRDSRSDKGVQKKLKGGA